MTARANLLGAGLCGDQKAELVLWGSQIDRHKIQRTMLLTLFQPRSAKMPHICPVYRASDDWTRAVLKINKTKFRELVAQRFGYEMSDVAVIPRSMSDDEIDLADNILPLEFVIDMGSRMVGKIDDVMMNDLKIDFCGLTGLSEINFGIWIRSFEHNSFVEHKPAS